ncbi:unnamed protein product [Linum trigynum]|uniref:Transposase n=1 Tax=Linum trigynum TaxID=586398 RepID=A0AAV2G630_9ROSI
MVTKGRNLKRLKIVRESHPRNNNQDVEEQSLRGQVQRESNPQHHNQTEGEQSLRGQVQRESNPQHNNQAAREQIEEEVIEETEYDGFTTYVGNTKFRYPAATTKWILSTVNRRWSDYKTKLKSKYYDPELSIEEILAIPKPEGVIDTHWQTLVNRWYTEEFQRLSRINAENASNMKTPHTCGRMSIARWKAIKTMETGKEPDRLETFENTHTRKNGTYVNGYTATLIEKAHTLRQEGSFDNEQIFQKVHGPEHPGRVRCAGLGPTPSTDLGPSSSSASINSTTTSNSNEVDALRSEVIELRNELMEAKSEVVELRSGMDQLQMEVDTLKTLFLQHLRREKGSMESSFRAPSSSSQSATRV